jgi:hypothetical protein
MAREEVLTKFWLGNLRERNYLEDPSVDRRIILKWIFDRLDGGAHTQSIWLRIGTDGRLL